MYCSINERPFQMHTCGETAHINAHYTKYLNSESSNLKTCALPQPRVDIKMTKCNITICNLL